MNQTPANSVKDLMLQNEALVEDNETLYETNEKLILEIRELRAELDQVQAKAERDRRIINGLKINNSALTLERNRLVEELNTIKSMSMFEFGNRYCSNESLEADGHAFARALGVGVRMSEDELKIDEAENAYVPYSGDDF
jgi:predicted RNase H-like nuclease (RuvC/YqgF family)